MTAPNVLPAGEVHDLEFVRISDDLSHKWVEWEVHFNYQGLQCIGFLGADPRHPNLHHDEIIVNIES